MRPRSRHVNPFQRHPILLELAFDSVALDNAFRWVKAALMRLCPIRATLSVLFFEQVTALKSSFHIGLFGSPIRDAFVIAA